MATSCWNLRWAFNKVEIGFSTTGTPSQAIINSTMSTVLHGARNWIPHVPKSWRLVELTPITFRNPFLHRPLLALYTATDMGHPCGKNWVRIVEPLEILTKVLQTTPRRPKKAPHFARSTMTQDNLDWREKHEGKCKGMGRRTAILIY